MSERVSALVLMGLMILTILAMAFLMGSTTLLDFVFFYPLFMSLLWITGGLYFWFHWERHWPDHTVPPTVSGDPLISIIIPCFNEGKQVEEVISAALAQNYRNIEVVAVNDGSQDETGPILDRLVTRFDKLRVVHLAENQGKAVALRMGAMAARSEYLVCIDGDAVLDPSAAAFLVKPLIEQPRVGAVTGNPRVRNRTNLISRIQVGEFSSIIGLIKRTQRVYGRLFTVSGVVVSFRRSAIYRVGYWRLDMITEDIDISWALQGDQWSVFYEPRALCWILVPETLKGLWKQRLRWAQGGAEVMIRYFPFLWTWRTRRMWPLALEFFLSSTWAFTYALSILLWAIGKFYPLPTSLFVPNIFPPAFTGMLLGLTCVMQFLTSALVEERYERGFSRSTFWVVWYPIGFWMINLFTTLPCFVKIALKPAEARARWISPDRGIGK